jgi:hypothetical protein
MRSGVSPLTSCVKIGAQPSALLRQIKESQPLTLCGPAAGSRLSNAQS